MPKGKNQHVGPHAGGGWGVKGEGNKRATVVKPTKQEAVEAGRKIAENQQSELFIKGADGRIQRRDSHGHDPASSKG